MHTRNNAAATATTVGQIRHLGIRCVLAILSFLMALTVSSQQSAEALSTEDVLFQIVGYYNPQLGAAQPLVHCILDGQSVDSCAQAHLEQQARDDVDVQRMLAVLDAYDKEHWGEVIELAGAGVACTWLQVPDALCSGFVQAAKEVADAAASVPGAALNAAEALLDAVPCLYNCGGDEFDPEAEWARCYAPRVSEGVALRLLGDNKWASFIRGELPTHSFAGGSLLASCYPAFAGTGSSASLVGAIADYLAQVNEPMRQAYIGLVEDAALASLDEAAQDYGNLQGLWAVRAVGQGMDAFVDTIAARGQIISLSFDARVRTQMAQCATTLSTPGAHMIDRWADAGAHANSTREVRGFTSASWPQQKPQAWCNTTYVPAFSAEAQRRITAYDAAIAQGCSPAREDRFSLSCPLLGGGMARCQVAFQAITRGHCSRAVLNLRVIPSNQPPPVVDAPPVTETAPPSTPSPPRVRVTPVPPSVMTPAPSPRPPR